MARCELRWWEDRVSLLEIFLDTLTDPAQVVELRNALGDAGAVEWMDAAIARRFGPSWVWRAHHSRYVAVDWDSLLTRLASPTLTSAQRIALLRAWLAVAPRDVDLLAWCFEWAACESCRGRAVERMLEIGRGEGR